MERGVVRSRGMRQPVDGGGSGVSGMWLVIALIALVGAVVGGGLLVRDWTAPDLVSGTASLGGLTARPHDAGWVNMDGHHSDQAGYQMPAQMMPGAPTGDEMRLGVPLTLVNTGGEARGFSLVDEFFLGGGRNQTPREMHSDTFGQLPRLAPGNAVDGVLYFDTIVPDQNDPPLYLLWQRDGSSVHLAIPRVSGNSEDHGPHG